MEIRKCANCGAFITTEGALCHECQERQNREMSLLKDYFDETTSFDSISSISATTGVSPTSIQKYMQDNGFGTDSNGISFSSIKY